MGLLPGYRVNEHVRLIRHLGRGGMGSVWVAHHEKLALDVAVKFVAADLLKSDDPLVLSRFQREAQLAARLDSPHTVRILDHGVCVEGGPYIVMELLEGRTIFERLRAEERIPVDEVVTIIEQVADGLEHAHALGIVHRDIKPPNLFLSRTRGGQQLVKIVDFGIAKTSELAHEQGVSTVSGVLIGTPQYMSPEQLMHAGPVGIAADLWGLAVVTYEMLTGRLPFTGETLAATLVAITRADAKAPTQIVPGLAFELDVFFRRALSVEPSLRYLSASSFAKAFQKAAAGAASAEDPAQSALIAVRADDANLATSEFLLGHQFPPERSKGEPDGPMPTAEIGFARTEPGAVTPNEGASAIGLPAPSTGIRKTRAAALIAGVAILAIALGGYALRKPPAAAGSRPSSEADATVSPSIIALTLTSDATVSLSVSAVPNQRMGAIPRLVVPAGFAPLTSMFVPGFNLVREEGDGDLDFAGAMAACERRGMALCSESQWLRACEVEPVLGREPCWTMTPTDHGVALRGGSDCSSRAVAFADTKSKERIGPCCSRAVSVRSSNPNKAFLTTTAAKVLAVERTINAANGLELVSMSLPKLNLFGKIMEQEEIISTVAWIGRKGSFYFDSCDVAISDFGVERRWTADCSGILKGGAEARRAHRWITVADGGLLSELRETKVTTSLRATHDKAP